MLDVINCDSDEINFVEHKELLKEVNIKLSSVSLKIEDIIKYKSQIELNANLKLLLDSVIIGLKGE